MVKRYRYLLPGLLPGPEINAGRDAGPVQLRVVAVAVRGLASGKNVLTSNPRRPRFPRIAREVLQILLEYLP